MRNLDMYDFVICDIDDTLIHGPWTNLMKLTWTLFKSRAIALVLMRLQDKLNLYKVNSKLAFGLATHDCNIVFLTVRTPDKSTYNVVDKICKRYGIDYHRWELVSLNSGDGVTDKANWVADNILDKGYSCIAFDDDPNIREGLRFMDVLTVDPKIYLEKQIG